MDISRITGRAALTAGLLLLPLAGACAPEEGAQEEPATEMEMEAGEGEMAAAGDPFEGEHELPEGRRVEMAAGQYTVYSAEDSVLVEGTYEVSGDTITLTDTAGEEACIGTPGVYTFTTEDGEVGEMELVEDACEPRRQDITSDQDAGTQETM